MSESLPDRSAAGSFAPAWLMEEAQRHATKPLPMIAEAMRLAESESEAMTWILNGWVVCPNCGGSQDGATMFGDRDDAADRWAVKSGLTGTCDHCGATIRIELIVEKPS